MSSYPLGIYPFCQSYLYLGQLVVLTPVSLLKVIFCFYSMLTPLNLKRWARLHPTFCLLLFYHVSAPSKENSSFVPPPPSQELFEGKRIRGLLLEQPFPSAYKFAGKAVKQNNTKTTHWFLVPLQLRRILFRAQVLNGSSSLSLHCFQGSSMLQQVSVLLFFHGWRKMHCLATLHF